MPVRRGYWKLVSTDYHQTITRAGTVTDAIPETMHAHVTSPLIHSNDYKHEIVPHDELYMGWGISECCLLTNWYKSDWFTENLTSHGGRYYSLNLLAAAADCILADWSSSRLEPMLFNMFCLEFCFLPILLRLIPPNILDDSKSLEVKER